MLRTVPSFFLLLLWLFRWTERTSFRILLSLKKNLSHVFDFHEVQWCFWKRMFVVHIQNYGLHLDIWLYCICISLTAAQCSGMLFDTEWWKCFCFISHCSITLLFLHVICTKLCLTVLFIADFPFFLLLSAFLIVLKILMLPLGKPSKIWLQILSGLY